MTDQPAKPAKKPAKKATAKAAARPRPEADPVALNESGVRMDEPTR